MPSARFEIEILAPTETVFAFVSDFGNDPKWRSNVIAMKPLGRDSDLGGVWSRQIEVRKVPGRTIETTAVVTACEPGRIISVQRANGPVRPKATYQLSSTERGTRLTFELDISLAGATWLALPLVWLFLKLAIEPSLRTDFSNLKAVLERGTHAPSRGSAN